VRAILISGAVLAASLLVACGGDSHSSGPKTAAELSAWLDDTGECEGAEMSSTKLPVPADRVEEIAPANERFDHQGVAAATISCGGANGYISYYRFRSAAARAAAVRGRDGLISNELFCVKGPELVVNDLLGYDNTIGFCKRLGFSIHPPTHVESPVAENRHHMESTAARLYSHATHLPLVNVYCESSEGRLEFECKELIGGGVAEISLVERRGHYVIRGCENPGTHRTGDGVTVKTCSFPTHPR
jgi:hypothetical protein